MNTIPKEFNNNIAWNFGHIVIATQALCYLRTGINPRIDIPFIDEYKKGSKPETWIPTEEIDLLKQQAVNSIHTIEQLMDTNAFAKFIPFKTETFGIVMHSIE